MTIRIFSFSSAMAHIDGENAGSSTGSDLVIYRTEHPRLISVDCSHTGIDSGLIVSVSNGFYSGEHLRCRNGFTNNNWYKLSYKEGSSWYSAKKIGPNIDGPNEWEVRSGFNANATWVWGKNDDAQNERYLFRGILGK